MPIGPDCKADIVGSTRQLIHAFQSYIDPKATVPSPIAFGKNETEDQRRCRYWMSQVAQAGAAVRLLLVPSVGHEYDGDPYPDIANSQFSETEKAALEALADFCKHSNLCYKGLARPCQSVEFLNEIIKKIGEKRKRDKKTEARNRWVYQQCCNLSKTYGKVAIELGRIATSKGWVKVSTIQGLRQIAKEYAEQNRLTPPPKRQGY